MHDEMEPRKLYFYDPDSRMYVTSLVCSSEPLGHTSGWQSSTIVVLVLPLLKKKQNTILDFRQVRPNRLSAQSRRKVSFGCRTPDSSVAFTEAFSTHALVNPGWADVAYFRGAYEITQLNV